ncbi:MAG: prenyltransferase [Dehalococcoidia bacterium]|nr:MAG: prenyltransferase [Dehalococcoidia bacterium]
MEHAATQRPPQLTFGQRFRNWRVVIATANLPRGAEMDAVSKWLLITRAAVFSMTLTSGLIGGLLAILSEGPRDIQWGFFALSMVGLVFAHASNNMINDYFDVEGGVDDMAYIRTQYAPHPLLSNLISKRALVVAILATTAVDGVIALYLSFAVGWLVMAFALAGLFVSAGYVMKPITLKRRGLGEIGVLIVWGPLMIGGTYYVTAGELPPWVWAACVPYSLVVMSVLIGKHLDKFEIDSSKGIKTLPVVLGYAFSMRLNQVIMVSFYGAMAALVLTGVLPVWTAVTLLALPRLWTVLGIYNRPKPDEPPPGYPIWPLWFVSAAFYFNKRAGELFVLGLIVGAVLTAYMPVYVDVRP